MVANPSQSSSPDNRCRKRCSMVLMCARRIPDGLCTFRAGCCRNPINLPTLSSSPAFECKCTRSSKIGTWQQRTDSHKTSERHRNSKNPSRAAFHHPHKTARRLYFRHWMTRCLCRETDMSRALCICGNYLPDALEIGGRIPVHDERVLLQNSEGRFVVGDGQALAENCGLQASSNRSTRCDHSLYL